MDEATWTTLVQPHLTGGEHIVAITPYTSNDETEWCTIRVGRVALERWEALVERVTQAARERGYEPGSNSFYAPTGKQVIMYFKKPASEEG